MFLSGNEGRIVCRPPFYSLELLIKAVIFVSFVLGMGGWMGLDFCDPREMTVDLR